MKNKNTLGIWVNYSYTFLTDLPNEQTVPNDTIPDCLTLNNELEFKTKLISKSMEEDQSKYYQRISDIIRNYTEVLVFGTTDAKKELISVLDQDSFFKDIKIELRETQTMTQNQLSAFCKS
jgi:ABC-type multidrug transport system fused ATPase/permease subunit